MRTGVWMGREPQKNSLYAPMIHSRGGKLKEKLVAVGDAVLGAENAD